MKFKSFSRNANHQVERERERERERQYDLLSNVLQIVFRNMGFSIKIYGVKNNNVLCGINKFNEDQIYVLHISKEEGGGI